MNDAGINLEALKPGALVRGAIFPEPVKVISMVSMGGSIKLICEGLETGRVHQPVLLPEQIDALEVSPDARPYDGDPFRFRLGVEAMRLGLAYEYDPYFSLSIAIGKGVSEGLLAYVGKSATGYEPFKFKESLAEGDVEITSDMYVIKAEAAERHIKPPELAQLIITPNHIRMEPGKKQTFVAKGTDQFGNDFNIDGVIWSATGGEIGVDGVFDAGDDDGNFIIQASTSGLTGNSEITISKEATPIPPTPPPPQGEKTLRWSGEIPTQKWMNFYTKVLTKLVTAGGLKVSVSIDSKPEGGVSERQVEDVKTSLRGLGLNDSVDSS